jgi:hypothetical protein
LKEVSERGLKGVFRKDLKGFSERGFRKIFRKIFKRDVRPAKGGS